MSTEPHLIDNKSLNNAKNNSYGEGKSLPVVVLLWFFLGFLAIHRFYLGHVGQAVFMLVSFIVIAVVVPAMFLSAGSDGSVSGDVAGWGMILSLMLGGIICVAWYFIDGLYVIFKMDRASRNG